MHHLSHSASGEAKWITKLPTEKIAHFCHSYKRKKKKKDTNINSLKTPVGHGIHLKPLFLSLFVPSSREKPDLGNCHGVLFKTKVSIKSPIPPDLVSRRTQGTICQGPPKASLQVWYGVTRVLESRYNLGVAEVPLGWTQGSKLSGSLIKPPAEAI